MYLPHLGSWRELLHLQGVNVITTLVEGVNVFNSLVEGLNVVATLSVGV